MDGTELNKILENYNGNDLLSTSIKNEDFSKYKSLCEYVGKGTNDKKLQHLLLGKQILLKQLVVKKISAKFSKITQIWEKGHGIVVMHLFTETNHYEALSREFATIKSIGINNITNERNSSPFGDMKTKWNNFEILNYGNMILYNSLKMAIHENPPLIYPEDILMPKRRNQQCAIEDFELEGILSCFLEL